MRGAVSGDLEISYGESLLKRIHWWSRTINRSPVSPLLGSYWTGDGGTTSQYPRGNKSGLFSVRIQAWVWNRDTSGLR